MSTVRRNHQCASLFIFFHFPSTLRIALYYTTKQISYFRNAFFVVATYIFTQPFCSSQVRFLWTTKFLLKILQISKSFSTFYLVVKIIGRMLKQYLNILFSKLNSAIMESMLHFLTQCQNTFLFFLLI